MLVNTRILHGPPTGVQRYLSEVLAAWPDAPPEALKPPGRMAQGWRGHAWEQLAVPARTGRSLLWSPVHSGPLAIARQVVTVHDVVPLDHPEWLNPRFARWYRFLLPRLVRRAAHVIAVSQFTRRRLLATTGVAPERVSVIPNGVSNRFRAPDARVRRDMRQHLGLADRRYLLAAGTLEPRKNLARLLAAWRRALPQLPDDLYLVLAGAPGRPAVFADAGLGELPPRVLGAGRVDDRYLPALYADAEWTLCLSLYEGFGLPVLEALACGTPVLVSDIEVFGELAGGGCITVDPVDTGAIADQLRLIARDDGLRQTLAARAIESAAAYSWKRTAEATHALLQRF